MIPIVIICLMAFSQWAFADSNLCNHALIKDDLTRINVMQNHFVVNRGLLNQGAKEASYEGLLHSGFLGRIQSLNNSQRWLNVGAGEFKAEYEYLTSQDSFSQKKAQVVSVSVSRPQNFSVQNFLYLKSKFGYQYLSGKFIEQYGVTELGQFDLITDVYGAVTYADHPDLVLKKYFELLKVGGSIDTLFYGTSIGYQKNTETLKSWFEKFEGVECDPHFGDDQIMRVHFKKVSEKVKIPSLTIIDIKPNPPPIRRYLLQE